MKTAWVLLIAGAACVPAWAVNKCTTPQGKVVFQDLPCDNTAKAEKPKLYSKGNKPAEEISKQGAALCEAMLRKAPAWKDPDSVQITDMRRVGFTTLKMHDASVMAVLYAANVNAKNSYGGYTGKKFAACYMDNSETRVLDISRMSDRYPVCSQ